jgi:peroxiredoxin (alkyl hydroperoxide reductase subunit C)
MAPSNKDGCTSPAKGPIVSSEPESSSATQNQNVKEVIKMTAKVGKPAPDFEANGYYQGGFDNFKLSDYKGQWVLLCFYPGDFTFV